MIRVLIRWADEDGLLGLGRFHQFEHWLDPMPTVPRVGETLDIEGIIPADSPLLANVGEEEADEFRITDFTVAFVTWVKDQQGYYAILNLTDDR